MTTTEAKYVALQHVVSATDVDVPTALNLLMSNAGLIGGSVSVAPFAQPVCGHVSAPARIDVAGFRFRGLSDSINGGFFLCAIYLLDQHGHEIKEIAGDTPKVGVYGVLNGPWITPMKELFRMLSIAVKEEIRRSDWLRAEHRLATAKEEKKALSAWMKRHGGTS